MNYDDFLARLTELNLSKEDFVSKAGIKASVLNTWGATRNGRKTASWVESWLDLYEENEKLESKFKNLSLKYVELELSVKG